MIRPVLALACALATVVAVPVARAADESVCGPLANAFGPFDYRTASQEQLKLVEAYHFTPKVEALQQGQTGPIAADLAYTLRAFPNHHRALMAMSRLAVREKRETLPGAPLPAECYFARAIRFQPEDPVPQMIYGLHLVRTGRGTEAGPYLERAESLGSDDANLHYNLGLAYVELKQFDKARRHAERAYQAGFPLPGLRDRLRQAGAWSE